MMEDDEDMVRDKALLVGVVLGGAERHICEEHLKELELLADTYGVDVAKKVPCVIRKFDPGTVLGSGKLEELVGVAQALNVNLVIFDDEILPSQQRNLEKIFGLTVMDRTELILGVFEERAQTHEARLQVELAEVKYQFPRLKRLWTHLSRQRARGGYLKGEGEKQIELDRRILKNRVEKLERELEEVQQHRLTQRAARMRSTIPIFALVGYTNAGKSTLMRLLTGADVFVEDKLFATLDTTTRKFTLPNNQESLMIDTVGFIRKLPHQLVAAFKSTLEESVQADILLHVVDVSSPVCVDQAEAAMQVLKELKADDKPIITVLNKVDSLDPQDPVLTRLRTMYPHTVRVSALTGEGIDDLLQIMVDELGKQRRVLRLRIPQSDYKITSEVIRLGQVLSQDYEGNDVLLRADVPADLAGRLSAYVESDL